MSVFEKMFGKGMFGPVPEGKCKLSMNGQIAINTPGGYKTYNVKTGKLTNCSNFAIDVGDMFFIVPTNKVQKGDIILVDGNPKCVLEEEGNNIKVFSYIDSTIDTIVKERHIFMGRQYFYGKIVSMLGAMTKGGGKTGGLLKYMMLSQLMKGGGMNALLPLRLMGKGGPDGLFDLDDDLEDDGNSDDKTDKEA